MFVFSKLFGLLINPLLWIVMLLLYAFFTRQPRYKRKSAGLALVLLLFFSNGWIIKNLMAYYQTKPRPMQPQEKYSIGILLGGMAGYDAGTKEGYFLAASDRFIQTLKLYKQGHIRKIIVTGGKGNIFSKHDFREADFLVENLIAMGVPAQDILKERNSRNTIENLAFTKGITDSLQVKEPCVLITSAFHMPRSQLIFEQGGIPIRPFPTNYFVRPTPVRFTLLDLIPSTDAFDIWVTYLREQTGILFLKLRGH